MLDAFYISAIGLQAQKEQLDALASNLANLGTTAFKRQSVDFAAILDRVPSTQGVDAIADSQLRPGRIVRIDQRAGDVRATGRALDVAIVGQGFFEIALPGDRIGYSRNGALQIGSEGVLSLASGFPLSVDVRVPAGARDVRVQSDGSVLATLAGDSTTTLLGQIELATFANPESLQYRGDGVFEAPADAEVARVRPGEEGSEPLVVGSLEGSNVSITDGMVELVVMQRIYELNSRVAQVADEMIGMSNNMRRT
jgi:flagellar basal-body rod protein FlgG